MDEIKIIPENYLKELVVKTGFAEPLLLKDYYIVLILYLTRNIDGMYFKGGTALNKAFLNHARLSEDIDLTLTRDEGEIKKEINSCLITSGFVKEITEGKNVDGFLRMVVKCKSDLGESEIFIDLNKRAKMILPSEINKINHFYYPFIPEFSFKTIAREELIAEKVRAAITRNKPRDHFDVYNVVKKGIPINLELVKEKCKEANEEFSIVRIFNNAKKLKNKWDADMLPLLAEPVSFQEVIRSLAEYFNLKEEKEKAKKLKMSGTV